MAAVKEQEVVKEVAAANFAAVMARASRFVQDYEKRVGPYLEKFVSDFHALRSDIVELVNRRTALERQIRDSEIVLARNEREARERLQSVELGHQALIDRLSKKEIELSNKLAEVEKREAAANAARQDAELLREEWNRQINAVTPVTPSKK